ncbi:MAG: FkbM family methyltransferase [Cyanobacteria bacterium J06621_8]
MKVESQISLSSASFWQDHQVDKTAIFPATGYINLALNAVKKLSQTRELEIEKFVVHQSLIIPQDRDIVLWVDFLQRDEKVFTWKIYSSERGLEKDQAAVHQSTNNLYASGKIVLKKSRQQPIQLITESKIARSQQVSVSDFYQGCSRRNIQYGDRFQIIKKLYKEGTSALGQVYLDSTKLDEPNNYLLHPVLLDSCLQVLWGALPEATGEDTYLPVAMEQIIIHRYPEINQACWSYAEITSDLTKDSRILQANLSLLDAQGHCLVELKGVAVERASQEALLYSLQPQQRIAIAASFTAEPVADSLNFWMQKLGIKSKIKFADYNQIFQELLNPSSLLSQNRDGVNLVLLRLEDWLTERSQLKLLVDSSAKQNILGDLPVHTLPNKIEVAHLNQYETEYLYQELFVDRVYARHGIVFSDDACVVDIGANIGLFTLFVQQQCPNATIYSFEPSPHAFARLKSNAELYCQNAHLFNCGLSGEDKSETFTFYPNSSVFSGFHAERESDEQAIRAVILNMLQQVNAGEGEELERLADEFMPGRLEVESFQAQLRTLSSIIEEHNIQRIDLLKLDAEKSELPVLQGIKEHHWELIQQMVVEVHDQEGSTINQVKQMLQDRGFQLTVVEENLLQGSGLYNIYAIRPENAANQTSANFQARYAGIEQKVKELGQALVTASESSATPYLVGLCPPSPKIKEDPELNSFYQATENRLADYLNDLRDVHVLLRSEEITAKYPVADYYDYRGDLTGSVPYTPEYYTALGTAIARKIRALKSTPYKVIVLDCDRTLWNGICGEDGAAGVTIDAPFQKLQEFMVAQSAAGMLLCLCSKNNEGDVWQVFDHHQQMPLQKKHLVQWRINWQAKSENIKSLAAELQLGLDSFIFIDDNPLECAEVRVNCPQVLTLQLPDKTEQIPQFLDQIWALDQLQQTEEDSQRTALYQQNVERTRFRQETLTFKDFLAGLNLQVKIAPPVAAQLARVAQLTQRTNQFNFTTIRRSEGEIKQLLDSGQLESLVVEVSDRFGDYGLVGVILYVIRKSILQVDSFLLSCRALGKGIEHQMLAKLGAIAQKLDLEEIELIYQATAKNQPALNFLDSVENTAKERIDQGWEFKLSADQGARVTYSPETTAVIEQSSTGSAVLSRNPQQLKGMMRIATELYQPRQILELIEAGKRRVRPPELASQFVAASNQGEEWLLQIWREVLTMEQIGIQDNFFELGGTSLLMVRVLSKLQEKYSELTLVDLYQYPTIETQARYLNQETEESIAQALQAVSERAKQKQNARKQRRQRRGGRI